MKQELWLAREKPETTGWYGISSGEPKPSALGHFQHFLSEDEVKSGKEGMIVQFCSEIFHALTTARLRKGRKRRIKQILIELED